MRIRQPKLFGLRKSARLLEIAEAASFFWGVDRFGDLHYHFDMEIHELSEAHRAAFLALLSDLEKSDRASFDRYFKRDAPWTDKEFAKYLKECQKTKMDWRPAANKTSITHYVMPGKFGEILAYGIMQFPLDEKLELDGGNLISIVSPKLRHQGYGSYCLALMLFEAVRAGLRRVLVTAPESDHFARTMIEKNRGILQDYVLSQTSGREGLKIARYWINF